MSHDGRQTWKLTNQQEGDDAPPSVVEVGGKIGDAYEGEAEVRLFLCDTVLPSSKPLYAQIAGSERAEYLGEERLDAAACLVVRWQTPLNGGSTRRETVWLDKDHRLVLRQYREEHMFPSKDDWETTGLWKVPEIGSTRFARDSNLTSEYWYPKRVIRIVSNGTNDLFNGEYLVSQLIINNDMPTSYFKPQIEEGSNVFDMRTGLGTVYGRGPSKRLQKMIKNQVEEARNLAREATDRKPPGSLTPPTPWTTYCSWIALSLGGLGLAIAIVWRIRH
jgi:hypothetical protein